MTHLYLVEAKNGDILTLDIPVRSPKGLWFVQPTRKGYEMLYPYPKVVNLSTTINDARYGWGKKIINDFYGKE